jgi:hypothetical protein
VFKWVNAQKPRASSSDARIARKLKQMVRIRLGALYSNEFFRQTVSWIFHSLRPELITSNCPNPKVPAKSVINAARLSGVNDSCLQAEARVFPQAQAKMSDALRL